MSKPKRPDLAGNWPFLYLNSGTYLSLRFPAKIADKVLGEFQLREKTQFFAGRFFKSIDLIEIFHNTESSDLLSRE
jgi:hypothetical protein